MAWVGILDRFRPVGAPGPVGPVGVPAADDQGPAAELAVVFAALAGDVEASRQVLEDARSAAAAELDRARAQAAAMLAQAQLDAGAERARATARVHEAAAQDDARLRERAVAQAAEIEAAGMARLPAMVDEIVGSLLAEPPGAPT